MGNGHSASWKRRSGHMSRRVSPRERVMVETARAMVDRERRAFSLPASASCTGVANSRSLPAPSMTRGNWCNTGAAARRRTRLRSPRRPLAPLDPGLGPTTSRCFPVCAGAPFFHSRARIRIADVERLLATFAPKHRQASARRECPQSRQSTVSTRATAYQVQNAGLLALLTPIYTAPHH